MKYALLFIVCLLAACSKPPPEPPSLEQQLLEVQCPNESDFIGTGVGGAENSALLQARVDMARRYFAKKPKFRMEHSEQNSAATPNAQTNSEEEVLLINPNNARLYKSKRQDRKVGVVVCMSVEDAAGHNKQMQKFLQDSLELMAVIMIKPSLAEEKKYARNKAGDLWIKINKYNELLKSWDVNNDISRAKKLYEMIENNYKEYCAGKLHWESKDTEVECSNIVFSALSKKLEIEKSACSGGLKLRFSCAEACSPQSYGMECSFEPHLSIESCKGEIFSPLKANKVEGTDINSESMARDKLLEELENADFYSEWEQEIKKWMPMCAE